MCPRQRPCRSSRWPLAPLQYELIQIVPLAVIAVIGIAFYFPDSKTRHEEIPESVMAAVGPAGDADWRP